MAVDRTDGINGGVEVVAEALADPLPDVVGGFILAGQPDCQRRGLRSLDALSFSEDSSPNRQKPTALQQRREESIRQ